MLMDTANIKKRLSSQASPQHLYAFFLSLDWEIATDAGPTAISSVELTWGRAAAERE